MECNIATLVVFSPLPYEKQLLFRRLRRSELGRLPLAFLDHDPSLMGVYRAHFGLNGMTFGSTNSSLAVLAFVVSLTMWSKWMCRCLCMKE